MQSRTEQPKSIRLAGGAARSKVWTQIFADVLQLPIETVQVNETGALGCAIAIATAVGDYENLGEAVKHMCSIAPEVLPDPEKKTIYERKYALYTKTIECLNDLWNDMQRMIEIQ